MREFQAPPTGLEYELQRFRSFSVDENIPETMPRKSEEKKIVFPCGRPLRVLLLANVRSQEQEVNKVRLAEQSDIRVCRVHRKRSPAQHLGSSCCRTTAGRGEVDSVFTTSMLSDMKRPTTVSSASCCTPVLYCIRTNK